MATAAVAGTAGSGRPISLERVFALSFGVLRKNPLATLGIAFLFGAVPNLGLDYAIEATQPAITIRARQLDIVAVAFVFFILSLLISTVTAGALARTTAAHAEGREARLGAAMGAGLIAILPAFAASVLAGMATLLGLIVLIVPGIILFCTWAVAVPVVVEERLGPLAALARSAELTRGARWKVFALMLVLMLAYGALLIVLRLAGGDLSGGSMVTPMAEGRGGMVALYLLKAGVETVTACLWSIPAAALYVELRDRKDGPPSLALAEVFA